MYSINLTKDERLQFQYILPVQGSLLTLELVDKILNKVKVDNIDDNESKEFDFENNELEFIKNMINILDGQGKLNFQSLSLVRKILNKENKDG